MSNLTSPQMFWGYLLCARSVLGSKGTEWMKSWPCRVSGDWGAGAEDEWWVEAGGTERGGGDGVVSSSLIC